jgi:hypothetical protein
MRHCLCGKFDEAKIEEIDGNSEWNCNCGAGENATLQHCNIATLYHRRNGGSNRDYHMPTFLDDLSDDRGNLSDGSDGSDGSEQITSIRWHMQACCCRCTYLPCHPEHDSICRLIATVRRKATILQGL